MSSEQDFTIPGVDILGEIGRGSGSVVYHGRHGDENLAIKIQRHRDPEESVRLRREALALARVRHAGLAQVRDVGETEGRVYIAMELVQGHSLADLLSGGPLPVPTVARIGIDVAGALNALHNRGLVHRDIKPSNIILDHNGRTRLIDLGFVASIESDKERAGFTGTWRYASPEQAGLLSRPVDGRSDLYSLGSVLFELLAGRAPFPAETVSEIIALLGAGTIPDIRSLRADVGPVFPHILKGLLAKDPDDRYQTSDAVAADLEVVLHPDAPGLFLPSTHRDKNPTVISFPLIGREQEHELLQRLWGEVAEGQGRVLLVRGPAGSGKSRLVREWFLRPPDVNELLLYGKCAPSDTTPLGPLRQAVEDWLVRNERLGGEWRQRADERVREAAGDTGAVLRTFSPRLARILQDRGQARPPVSDQFFDIVSEFFLRLARGVGRAALVIEDVHCLDDASAKVLERLLPHLRRAPLLVVATRREGEPGAAGQVFVNSAPDEIRLAPFNQEAIEQLTRSFLGGEGTDPGVVAFVTERCEGNPFVLNEILQSMMDTGALRLDWGRWVMDTVRRGLPRLPSNILDLVLSRITDLGPGTSAILSAAAVVGNRFPVRWLPALCGVDPSQVNAALEEARRVHLVEPETYGDWTFAHDRVREALLSGLASHAKKRLHRKIADILERSPREGTDLYALAEHLYWGDGEYPRTEASNRAAAEAAIREYAFERALVFFERAKEAMRAAGKKPEPAFDRAHAEALAATGRTEEADICFKAALVGGAEGTEAARVRYGLAKIALGRLDTRASRLEIERGFKALGTTPPRPGPLGVLISLLRGAWGLLRELAATSIAPPQQYTRWRLMVKLHEHLVFTSYFNIDPLTMLQSIWENWPMIRRLGLCSERVAHYSMVTGTTGSLGLSRLCRFAGRRAIETAEILHDPISGARGRLFAAIGLHFLGETLIAEKKMRQLLADKGALLENMDFLTGTADLSWNLLMRGYAAEAWEIIQKGIERSDRAGEAHPLTFGHTYRCYAGPALAMIGRPAEGVAHLNTFEKRINPSAQDRWRRGQLLSHRLLFFLEQNELGAEFERTWSSFRALNLNPRRTPLQLKQCYVALAYARARQRERAPESDRQAARDALRMTLAELKRAGAHPTLRAHRWVIEAKARRMDGRPGAAHRALDRARALALATDNPWVHFEILGETARALARRGQQEAAQREALAGHKYAQDHGWIRRARALAGEFQLMDALPGAAHKMLASSDTPQTVLLRRHFDALLDVTTASMSRIDPDDQARGVLDEIVRILGAERAFLFLSADDGKNLTFTAGRDQNRRDLPDAGLISRTALDHALTHRAPLVINTGDGTAVSAAESVVAHGLRSLIVAPILYHARLIGVIYADSRVASGLFAQEDLGILNALANHIAVAMETSRALRLEIQLRSEHAQAQLGETVRRVSADLNSTLELPDVLSRLLGHVARFVAYDRGVVFLVEGQRARPVASRGFGADELPVEPVALASYRFLEKIVRGGEPLLSSKDAGLRDAHYLGLAAVGSWLAIPLRAREEVTGFLAIDRFSGDPFNERDADMVATFTGAAAVAAQNARLFGETQRMATIDGLTGLFNRNHFFQLAEQEIRRGRRHKRGITVLMADIDHFKKINDRHGHQAGDRVLAEVAQCLRKSVRDVDIGGRYGGEEFVVLLPETLPPQALLVAERVRHAVSDLKITSESERILVTISLGLAGDQSPESLSALIKTADAALYRAKESGRNRVVV